MPPVVDLSKCVACGTCIDICPMQVFRPVSKNGRRPEIAFPKECWHCNSCVTDCAKGAMSLRFPMPFMMLRERKENLC